MSSSLPNYIRTFRRRVRLSQGEVAFLLGGASGTSVLRHEDDQRVPTLDMALGYATIFRADAREIFAGRYEAVADGIRTRAQELLVIAREQLPTKEVEQKIAHLVLLTEDEEPHAVPWVEE